MQDDFQKIERKIIYSITFLIFLVVSKIIILTKFNFIYFLFYGPYPEVFRVYSWSAFKNYFSWCSEDYNGSQSLNHEPKSAMYKENVLPAILSLQLFKNKKYIPWASRVSIVATRSIEYLLCTQPASV